MNSLRDSFEEVAEWCERHLEAQKGREIGMTFGVLLRAYGRLAVMPGDPEGPKHREADRKAEKLLLNLIDQLSPKFTYGHANDHGMKMAEAKSIATNFTYDTGPQQ